MNCEIDRKTLELLVLAAYSHDEISIGRARELLKWDDIKIKIEADSRVSSAIKMKEYRDKLENENEWLKGRLENSIVHKIKICKLPYQEHPFVHGVRNGKDVWLKEDGSWTQVEDYRYANIPIRSGLRIIDEQLQ